MRTPPYLFRRVACVTAASVLGLLTAVCISPTGAVAAAQPGSCPGQSAHTTNAGTFVRTHHPLVLVHGWSSKSDSMGQVEQKLKGRLPNTFDFRYFDYRDHATDWAARPAIAACLADYVNQVSKNFRDAGGDGKVFLVAHSMGGLAIRFATDPATVVHPVPGSEIGGIVTIDTPHLGSVFGNTWQSSLIQWAKQHLGMDLAADHTSDAAKCLAIHDNRNHALPAGCATPPYLPANTRLAEISGTNTVQRTLFGIHLYDIPLNSDGIVSVDSSHGYLTSGPAGQKPPRTIGMLPSAECSQTSDQAMSLLQAAAKGKNLPAGIISAKLKALSILHSDSATLDAIDAGRLTPNLEVMLGVTYAFSDCGHSAMLHSNDAMDQAASALKSFLQSTAPLSCPTAQQFVAALPASDRALVSHTSFSPTGVSALQCASTWAAAGVDFVFPGAFDQDGQPLANTVTVVEHYVGGRWTKLDRDQACGSGRVPQKIYPLACRGN